MCNHYVQSTTTIAHLLSIAFGIDDFEIPADLQSEIYPRRPAVVVLKGEGGFQARTMRWGFEREIGGRKKRVTNVRNLKSPMWRMPLESRRCLVPAEHFFEPDPNGGECRFSLSDRTWFCFAGVWEPSGDEERFAFLTTSPNSYLEPIHPKAMPVILPAASQDHWLDSTSNPASLANPSAEGMDVERPSRPEQKELFG